MTNSTCRRRRGNREHSPEDHAEGVWLGGGLSMTGNEIEWGCGGGSGKEKPVPGHKAVDGEGKWMARPVWETNYGQIQFGLPLEPSVFLSILKSLPRQEKEQLLLCFTATRITGTGTDGAKKWRKVMWMNESFRNMFREVRAARALLSVRCSRTLTDYASARTQYEAVSSLPDSETAVCRIRSSSDDMLQVDSRSSQGSIEKYISGGHLTELSRLLSGSSLNQDYTAATYMPEGGPILRPGVYHGACNLPGQPQQSPECSERYTPSTSDGANPMHTLPGTRQASTVRSHFAGFKMKSAYPREGGNTI
ncbi:hypothetical protein DPEC_G00350690 [Dallia pectoralis]|uniref:Uncharacterized protein n=1 Tax=Dallia pectoralis TaxID=75939 RepID=A0ACC2F1S8_DALPE|nr:hypothetical protein DPEC_G00350690 [Dallia pectoralis]